MTNQSMVTHGILKPDGRLELDEKPNLPPGRVQVILQPVAEKTGLGLLELLEKFRKENETRGFKPRTREQIDADLAAMRNEWEERQRQLDQIREDGRREREQKAC